MDKLRLILMAVFLFVAVCFDIKRKTIPVLWVALNTPVMLVYGYIETGYSFLWGVLVGVIILVFSLISRGGIGRGDAAVVGICGGYIGFGEICISLIYGLVFCSAFGAMIAVKRRKWRNSRIIFTPFLALGILLAGGGYLG